MWCVTYDLDVEDNAEELLVINKHRDAEGREWQARHRTLLPPPPPPPLVMTEDIDAASLGLPTGFGAAGKKKKKEEGKGKGGVAAEIDFFASLARGGTGRRPGAEEGAERGKKQVPAWKQSLLAGGGRRRPGAPGGGGHAARPSSSSPSSPSPPPSASSPALVSAAATAGRMPVSHEVMARSEAAAQRRGGVFAAAVSARATQLAAGGGDGQLALFEFNKMDEAMRPYRTLLPCEGHPVRLLAFEPGLEAAEERLLVVTGDAQLAVHDAEGSLVGKTIKGDSYLYDLGKTRGHTASINCAAWHPTRAGAFVTGSLDGTVRMWDVGTMKRMHVKLWKMRANRRPTNSVTALAIHAQASEMRAALLDGALMTLDPRTSSARPVAEWKSVHAADAGASCIAYGVGTAAQMLLTRGAPGDATMALWDVRKAAAPVHRWDGLPSDSGTANCIFSPDGRLALTGTASRDGGPGALVAFDTSGGGEERRLAFDAGESVHAVQWHTRLNQLIVASSNGTRMLYDTHTSIKGAMLFASRTAKRRAAPTIISHDNIITPGVDDSHSLKRKRDAADDAAPKEALPFKPRSGPGFGPFVGSRHNPDLMKKVNGGYEEEVVQSLMTDPVEALMKYATPEEKAKLAAAKAEQQE